MEKLVIIGNGIAGCTAALYAARADIAPLVYTGPESGGQLTLTTTVDNFPGFPDGILGPELVENAKKQAEKYGAKFKFGIVTKFEKKKDHYVLTIDNKDKVEASSVIVATGASARWLGIESEKTYKGKGVHTCATCDGYFYKDKTVVVVGGGDSAMEESLVLAKLCTKVTVLHRRDEFRASKAMQKRFTDDKKTNVIWNVVVEEILGDGKKVTGVKLKDTKTGEKKEVKTDGVFLAIGHVPNTTIFKGLLDMDNHGYLKVDGQLKTKLPGVFAAGDVHDNRYRQAVTAAGAGCQAALEVQRYLAEKGL
tara:strand:+ start:640 stop:1563 length:924 start_codon:yes stop_codon:yes gene_type:complete